MTDDFDERVKNIKRRMDGYRHTNNCAVYKRPAWKGRLPCDCGYDAAPIELDDILARLVELESIVKKRPDWPTEVYNQYRESLIERDKLQERIDKLETALYRIQEWDCLNPPNPNMCHDHPWLKRHVDATLLEKP